MKVSLTSSPYKNEQSYLKYTLSNIIVYLIWMKEMPGHWAPKNPAVWAYVGLMTGRLLAHFRSHFFLSSSYILASRDWLTLEKRDTSRP